jgi:hypothetical protein
MRNQSLGSFVEHSIGEWALFWYKPEASLASLTGAPDATRVRRLHASLAPTFAGVALATDGSPLAVRSLLSTVHPCYGLDGGVLEGVGAEPIYLDERLRHSTPDEPGGLEILAALDAEIRRSFTDDESVKFDNPPDPYECRYEVAWERQSGRLREITVQARLARCTVERDSLTLRVRPPRENTLDRALDDFIERSGVKKVLAIVATDNAAPLVARLLVLRLQNVLADLKIGLVGQELPRELSVAAREYSAFTFRLPSQNDVLNFLVELVGQSG